MKRLIFYSLFLTSFILFHCSNPDSFESQYKQALKLFAQNQRKESLKILQDIYNNNPDYKNTRMLIGKIYFYNQDFEKALNFFSEEKEDYPEKIDPLIWYIKAEFSAKKNLNAILDDIEFCLQKDSSNLEALFIRAKIYQSLGNIQEAIKSYNSILVLSSISALAHSELANLYSKTSLKDKVLFHQKMANIILESIKED